MTFTAFIAAVTGRRIATVATAASSPVDVADLTTQLAASQAEVRRLLDKLAEAAKTDRAWAEEVAQLRAANERLANEAEAALVERYHPLRPPALSDSAARQAAQDRRNAAAAQQRVRELEAENADLRDQVRGFIRLVAG